MKIRKRDRKRARHTLSLIRCRYRTCRPGYEVLSSSYSIHLRVSLFKAFARSSYSSIIQTSTMSDDSRKLKLMYFNIAGKAEAIRLICAYAGLTLDDHRFKDRSEFAAMVNISHHQR